MKTARKQVFRPNGSKGECSRGHRVHDARRCWRRPGVKWCFKTAVATKHATDVGAEGTTDVGAKRTTAVAAERMTAVATHVGAEGTTDVGAKRTTTAVAAERMTAGPERMTAMTGVLGRGADRTLQTHVT